MAQLISKREESGSRRVRTVMDSESKTEQHHANEVDINSIMRKYRKTGVLPEPSARGIYGDFAFAEDFHTTQNRVVAANELFNNLPSDIRTQFDNDAGAFLGFVNDPENADEAREMGLLPPIPPPPKKPREDPGEDLPLLKEKPGKKAEKEAKPPKEQTTT